jgi:CDP-diacylglycerol--glycerol-3-phosphate 3-phosphatidyltransferase
MKFLANKSLPNWLTIFRLFITPVVCFLILVDIYESRIVGTVLLIFGFITDFLDGYLARKYKSVSDFGRCFDPIADKALVLSSSVMLLYLEKLNILIVFIMIFREVFVSGIREFVGTKSIIIKVSDISKVKTLFQMIGIVMLFIAAVNDILLILGNFLLFFGAGLSIYSAFEYYKSIRKYI